MSINRMYYGTKKIYSFLENGNQGSECNCEQEYQNGYNQGYQDGQNSVECPEVGGSSNPLIGLGWEDGEAAEIMDYVKSVPNQYERYVNYNSGEDGAAQEMFLRDIYNPIPQTPLVFAPFIDLSNQTSLARMFEGQESLVDVPWMYTSNITNFGQVFCYCKSLRKVPNWDFSNANNFYLTFRGCEMKEIVFDAPLATSYNSMCVGIKALKILIDGTNCTNIDEFLGWYSEDMPTVNYLVVKNLKCNWTDGNGFACCPNITYESIVEQINQLADMNGTEGRTLKIHQNTMNLLSSDDIAIAVSKNWTIEC